MSGKYMLMSHSSGFCDLVSKDTDLFVIVSKDTDLFVTGLYPTSLLPLIIQQIAAKEIKIWLTYPFDSYL